MRGQPPVRVRGPDPDRSEVLYNPWGTCLRKRSRRPGGDDVTYAPELLDGRKIFARGTVNG